MLQKDFFILFITYPTEEGPESMTRTSTTRLEDTLSRRGDREYIFNNIYGISQRNPVLP